MDSSRARKAREAYLKEPARLGAVAWVGVSERQPPKRGVCDCYRPAVLTTIALTCEGFHVIN